MRLAKASLAFILVLAGCSSGVDPSSSLTDPSNVPPVSPDIVNSFQCSDSLEAEFNQNVWPTLSECMGCHGDNALSNESGLNLISASPSRSFRVVEDYLRSHEPDTFFLKPARIVSHGGGRIISPDSAEFSNIQVYVVRSAWIQEECQDTPSPTLPPDNTDLFEGVTEITLEQTLRKAAHLFAGREPTEDEIFQVNSGGEESLRTVLRFMMTEPGFKDFLRESANDHFLTLKLANSETPALDVIDNYLYTSLFAAGDSENRSLINYSIAAEPMEYVVHVVTNDLPYTEILTADYHMMNPYSNYAFNGDAGPSFNNPNDVNEWREADLTGYMHLVDGVVPTAGILTSPAFLTRYPTTETNRNRARARWIAYFFLGIDIERLVNRAQDSGELRAETNPGDSTTSCYGCHSIMDPIAGALQNWSDRGAFKYQNGNHSFSDTYVYESGLYQEGDTWYRDNLLAPGFNRENMPTVGDAYTDVASPYQDGAQWLAEQIVSNPLFATGTAKFWFKGVFGKDPAFSPTEYEQNLITNLGDVLRQSNYDLKTMLIEMALTPFFRAETVVGASPTRQVYLEGAGVGNLLSPEQLNRKVEAVFGASWQDLPQRNRNLLLEDYYLIYGGIDSANLSVRPKEMNTLMSSVVMRLANEMSCAMVYGDFAREAGSRRFFGAVSPSTVPTQNDYASLSAAYRDDVVSSLVVDENAIRQTLQRLHSILLNEELALDDPEIDGSLALWTEIWQHRIDNNYPATVYSNVSGADQDEHCFINNYESLEDNVNSEINNGTSFSSIKSRHGDFYNPEQTIRAWVAVMTYLLTDYRFIHE